MHKIVVVLFWLCVLQWHFLGVKENLSLAQRAANLLIGLVREYLHPPPPGVLWSLAPLVKRR